MSDFSRAKIVFALALVGVLYAVNPLIREFGHQGFVFFESVLQFRVIYYTLIALLGLAVYFFAIDFLSETPLGTAHRLGNLFYGMALLFPPVFVLVWLSIRLAEAIVWASDSSLAGEISKIAFAIILAATGVLVAYVVSRRMNLRDREANLDELAYRAKGHLQRATELHEAGHSDLVALEAFRSLEAAMQRALINGNIRVPSSRPHQLIPIAAKAGVIPENLVGIFHELRVARNRAVHATAPFTADDAAWFLDTTEKMLNSIRAVQSADDCEEAA